MACEWRHGAEIHPDDGLAGALLLSMPKSRFRRCAQVIEARRSAGVDSFGSSLVPC
jgi:hypothetical protein